MPDLADRYQSECPLLRRRASLPQSRQLFVALPSVRDAGLVWPQTAHGFSRNAAPPDKTKLIKA